MRRRAILLCVATAALISCTRGGDTASEATITPLSLEGTECEACGMTVSAQPSPRGQLVHADGTHAFFCSLADMVAYLGSPSPHGTPVATFVEAMPGDVDPESTDLDEQPWVPTSAAAFVIGDFDRPVMGRPILSFESESDAEAAAARLDGDVVTWDALPAHIH